MTEGLADQALSIHALAAAARAAANGGNRSARIVRPAGHYGTGIPTAALAEQFKAGDSVPVLAKEYGASEEAVWDAIRCELDLKAA